jgi:NDP-sugar pyrophosphorylase family protein
MTDKIVILAGGISSRMKKKAEHGDEKFDQLYKEADEKSKTMIGLGSDNRPFLDYLLYNCKLAGIKDILIVIGEKDNTFREYYGSLNKGNQFNGLSISFAVQKIPGYREKPWGTADALYQGLLSVPEWKNESFLVVNSDNLYSVKAMKLLCEFEGMAWIDYDRKGFEFEESRVEKFCVTKKDNNGFLENMIEKPAPEDIEQYMDNEGIVRVSMNLWKFKYDKIFEFLENCPEHPQRKEKELPTAVMNMTKKYPKSIKGIPVCEHVPDLTNKDDIIPTREYLINNFKNLKW